MAGRIVLVTGANGGLGTAITEVFLNSGMQVAGVSRSVGESDFGSPNFHAFAADITQPQPTRDVVQKIVGQFGRIDILVHVAGGFAAAKVHETDDVTWNHMRDLNLSSGFYVAREVIPVMRKQKFGRIVAIGSLAAVEPHAALGAYASFKAALAMLFRTIAIENQGAGITSNIILPGTMDTPANRVAMPKADASKWVQPADVAKLVLWLTRDEAAQVNGALIPISSE